MLQEHRIRHNLRGPVGIKYDRHTHAVGKRYKGVQVAAAGLYCAVDEVVARVSIAGVQGSA